jgi:hypothetical protein
LDLDRNYLTFPVERIFFCYERTNTEDYSYFESSGKINATLVPAHAKNLNFTGNVEGDRE